MVKWLLLLAGAYVILVLVVYFLQQRLLYFPSHDPVNVSELLRHDLAPWPEQGFRGYLGPEPPQPRGTILMFHGNAGTAWHRSYYANALTRLGYRVLLVEYTGYGGRHGTPDQQSLTDDGLQTLKLAEQHFDGPVYLWGGVARGRSGGLHRWQIAC